MIVGNDRCYSCHLGGRSTTLCGGINPAEVFLCRILVLSGE